VEKFIIILIVTVVRESIMLNNNRLRNNRLHNVLSVIMGGTVLRVFRNRVRIQQHNNNNNSKQECSNLSIRRISCPLSYYWKEKALSNPLLSTDAIIARVSPEDMLSILYYLSIFPETLIYLCKKIQDISYKMPNAFKRIL